MCPYGRLQSVLLDEDSLVVGYDVKRGEPRGKATARMADAPSDGSRYERKAEGDCVDCNRCVVVCPTGIDIRNGLQLDCLACTACIDACDDVMTKVGRPRGLIRYDSPNGLAGKARKLVRPRLVLYTGMLVVGATVAFFATRSRTDFEVNASRLRGAPYTIESGSLRNAFDLHLVNKRGGREAFLLSVDVPDGIDAVLPVTRVEIDSLADTHVPLFLTMAQARFHGDVAARIRVTREASDGRDAVFAPITFLGASP
jgi:cytochrome c oxidase accessory protein FixG